MRATGGADGDEAAEAYAVGHLQAGEAARPGGALRRSTNDQPGRDGSEVAISFAKEGPQGDQGPPGPPGPRPSERRQPVVDEGGVVRVGLLIETPLIMAVHPNLPVKSLEQEFPTWEARARPIVPA